MLSGYFVPPLGCSKPNLIAVICFSDKSLPAITSSPAILFIADFSDVAVGSIVPLDVVSESLFCESISLFLEFWSSIRFSSSIFSAAELKLNLELFNFSSSAANSAFSLVVENLGFFHTFFLSSDSLECSSKSSGVNSIGFFHPSMSSTGFLYSFLAGVGGIIFPIAVFVFGATDGPRFSPVSGSISSELDATAPITAPAIIAAGVAAPIETAGVDGDGGPTKSGELSGAGLVATGGTSATAEVGVTAAACSAFHTAASFAAPSSNVFPELP